MLSTGFHFVFHLFIFRDIKLENIVLGENEQGETIVKLIDFGCATYFTSGQQKMSEQYGSIFYIDPEVLLCSYSEKCDLWSIGIIAYACLFGSFPFDHAEEDQIARMILTQRVKFSVEQKELCSKRSRKFIRSMLDQKKRISLEEALKSKWMKFWLRKQ